MILIFSMLAVLSLTAVWGENVTVTNDYNTDINDTKYINPNDYYFDENHTRVDYTSDTGSFNNVTMSNGYNAYAIQDGGWIETNDSKTHPSFWKDTYYPVDANDSDTVVGHWYYTGSAPIGEYLKILFYSHYDELVNLNSNYPHIPSSIFVQSMIWDLYKNAGDISKLSFELNRESVRMFDEGFRVNNTGNVQWINNTAYRIFDFLGFRNLDASHKDLWGFRVSLFNVSADDNSTDPIKDDESIEESEKNVTKAYEKSDLKNNVSRTGHLKDADSSPFKVPFTHETGYPIIALLIVTISMVVVGFKK